MFGWYLARMSGISIAFAQWSTTSLLSMSDEKNEYPSGISVRASVCGDPLRWAALPPTRTFVCDLWS